MVSVLVRYVLLSAKCESGYYLLRALDNHFFYSGEVPDTNTEVPLQSMENALGRFLHFTRAPDGTLTRERDFLQVRRC